MIQLIEGKLYQVRYEREWIIAEYVKRVEAHSYKYNNFHMDTLRIGPEKVRHVPLSHLWKKVRAQGYNSNITVLDKGMEVREASEEIVAQIAQLKGEVAQYLALSNAKAKELRELCG